MIKFLGWTNIVLVLMVAFLYYKPPITLFDNVQLDSIECPGIANYSASIFGVGGSAKAHADEDCNDRATAQLMLATGMPDNARIAVCRSGSSMRNFATVDNCMNADRYGYTKIMADLNKKYHDCGGKPRWYRAIKRKRFKKCMERVI